MQVKSNNSFFRSTCPISSALDFVGDKWSLLIIRDIILSNKKTFTDFATSEEHIATNILSSRLKSLEEAGILIKSRMPDNKKTFIYSLTQKGLDFLPIIVEYILWSNKYLNDHILDEVKQFAQMLKNNKEQMIQQITSAYSEAENNQ